jgi:hypothetical protein
LREFIWIDAETGGLLLNFSQLHKAKNRQVYNANNGPALPGTLARSEGAGPTGNPEVDDAYTLSGVTYDYFFSMFGRDSFDGAGGTLVSSVNWNDGASCPNAFWNGAQMVYCLGYASADDVVAHELTHAVTEYEANLFYFVQSGALNESYSDIFGETVDQLTPTVFPDLPGNRWHVGEDLPGGSGPIRDMMDPTEFFHPGKMSDSFYFSCDPSFDGGGVHTNSGIPNHAFALMVDGGTYNGHAITGIGLDKAARIQYRALSTYLTTSSGFLDNFNALNQSCSDLRGTAGITSADCAQVETALRAVEMNAMWGCIDFTQVSLPAMCPAGGSPAFTFQNGFEGASPPWGLSSTSATQWGLQTFNALEGTQAAIGPNPDSVSDHRIAMTSSTAPLPAGSRAMFSHVADMEVGFDGGVVEYSINGGVSWLDAVTLIDGGLLPDTVLPVSNPLSGRFAFTMPGFGYQKTRLNLSTLTGQSVRLRFRVGTDGVIGATGWMVDDVMIYSCPNPAGAPAITLPPAFQAVQTGGTATFSVTATGNPTLRHQWFKNGAPIAGATSATLILTNVQTLDYGFYSVKVSNDLGTATSDAVALLVVPAAVLHAATQQPHGHRRREHALLGRCVHSLRRDLPVAVLDRRRGQLEPRAERAAVFGRGHQHADDHERRVGDEQLPLPTGGE